LPEASATRLDVSDATVSVLTDPKISFLDRISA
jgi:hypothetical protein